MRFFFAIIALALLVAALSGAALSWDGSYYLFQTLDARAVFVPYDRLQDFVLGWPALLASYVTGDLSIIRAVFGL